ncbi:MAG: 3-mercaptopyruvate sulfurtransferase [Alphaproteobacteria bacterium]|nr:3-mercaptopyruvate sulfurtransferase [Alphaproteobacteria bacterium]
MKLPDPLVSTEWLAEHISAPDIRIIDASWHFPASGRNARDEYGVAHIEGALFFDIDDIADTASPYPHMLPDAVKFASRVRKLGLGDGNRIVVYDQLGLFSAPRAWWMFRAMGHADVVVLDGGLPKWIAEGRPLDDLPPIPRERHFTPRPNRTIIRDLQQMKANLASKAEQVIDARSSGRFMATEPEPRPGLKGGHIPGSINIPYTELLQPNGTMKPAAVLKELFSTRGIDTGRPITATCGSGVTAAIIALGLARIGNYEAAIYDGSWSEWGTVQGLPIEA